MADGPGAPCASGADGMDEGPGAPSPMQEEQPSPSCKRPAPETPPGALAPTAGSTETSNKKAKRPGRTPPLDGPRASFALATESSITLAVVLPDPSSGSELVELVLKFVDDDKFPAGRPDTVKVDNKQELKNPCILVKLSGLKLGHSCAWLLKPVVT